MGCDDYVINLIVAEEWAGLGEFSADEDAESGADHSGSSSEEEVEGPDVLVVGGE